MNQRSSCAWRALCLLTWLGLFFQSGPFASADANKQQPQSRANPAARLLTNEFASEHWEFTARFDSGHFVFVHFFITNIGWGDRNAVVVGHVLTPDGLTHQFDNSRRESNWKLSSDRLRFEIGPHTLDLHEPQYRLQVNKKSLRLDLRFQVETPITWPETLQQSGYTLDLLAVAVPVKGTLWLKGMETSLTVQGALAATHSWMQESSSSVMVRRLEFFTLQTDFPLYSVDLLTPSGAPLRWLVVKQQEEQSLTADAFTLRVAQEVQLQKEGHYAIPGELHLMSKQLNGQITLERLVVRYDPFAKLPGPLRFLASTILNLNPLQVWTVSPFAIIVQPGQVSDSFSSQDAARQIERQGTGITAITFLSPFSDVQRVERRQ